jgi:hypothetical protein
MTIRTLSALAAVLAATAFPAVAQDASSSVDLSLESSTSASSAATEGPLDAQMTSDDSYASLTAAINAGASVDLSAVTDSAKVSIVKVSTLAGDAATEGAALDAAIGAQSTALTTLRSDAGANAAINGKLTEEGFTMDDVLAIRTDASGNTLVYVDDRS